MHDICTTSGYTVSGLGVDGELPKVLDERLSNKI